MIDFSIFFLNKFTSIFFWPEIYIWCYYSQNMVTIFNTKSKNNHKTVFYTWFHKKHVKRTFLGRLGHIWFVGAGLKKIYNLPDFLGCFGPKWRTVWGGNIKSLLLSMKYFRLVWDKSVKARVAVGSLHYCTAVSQSSLHSCLRVTTRVAGFTLISITRYVPLNAGLLTSAYFK